MRSLPQLKSSEEKERDEGRNSYSLLQHAVVRISFASLGSVEQGNNNTLSLVPLFFSWDLPRLVEDLPVSFNE